MADAPRDVRIFVSSPGDVMAERQRLERVAERLNGRLGGAVHFECVRWEERFYSADRTFQAQIAPSVACDLVISIFWTRLGTALPPEFDDKLPDGRPYPSGTAYELLTALEAARQKALPDVFVFRKTAPSPTPTDDPVARQVFNRQLDSLEAFWEEWFRNREGQFRAAFNSFANTDEFEAQVEKLLRHWLAEKSLLRREVRWRIEDCGSPFRGLLPFDAQHAEVFFGRGAEIERGRERLADAAAGNTPFLLILGASGTGKSSLARAGLIPRLQLPGAVEGVDAWRVARLAPGIGEHDPLKALAMALLESDALPELSETPNATPEGLAGQMAQGPEAAAGLVRWAIDRVARQLGDKERFDRPVVARLILLIDQFESLFAAEIPADHRRAFIAALDGLVRSGLVWTVATIRSTDYALLQGDTTLLKLKESGATLDLATPDSVALAAAIEGPAEAAGLAFEHDIESGHNLDRILRDDAGGADALPLLQFTLQNLFESRADRNGTPTLTIAAYRALGGIEGAIAAEAERTVSALPAEAQAQLPWLLRQLVGIGQARGDAAATLRDMALVETDLATRPGARALIDALVAARVLVLDAGGQNGARRARLAHEAVLRSWKRTRDMVSENARFFRVREEFAAAFARWQREDKATELLLPAGTPLAEAESLVASHRDELPEDWYAYARASRRRANRARYVAYGVAAGMAVLFAASAVAGVIALRSEQHAALERDAALIAQSRQIATQARQLSQQGDVGTALALSLEALPARLDRPDRPFDTVAEGALLEQTLHLRERKILAGHGGRVTSAGFSPDGKKLVTGSWDFTARVWDAVTGKELLVLKGHNKTVAAALFTPDGRFVVTASYDNVAAYWDAASGKLLGTIRGHSGPVIAAAISADQNMLATGSWDKTARVWNTNTGHEILKIDGHQATVYAVAFSPDGKRLVTGSEDRTARVWEIATGKELAVLRGHDGPVVGVAFSRDGRQVATASWDKTARLWNAETGQETNLLRGHQDMLSGIAFSPDGQNLLTTSWDRTLRYWSLATGSVVAILRGHNGVVDGGSISPDGTQVASASEDGTARLWEVATVPEVRALRGHEAPVTRVAFSPDNARVASASEDNTVRVWDTTSATTLTILRGHSGVVTGVSFSPDGSRILTSSYDKTAQVWDAATGRSLLSFTGHNARVYAAIFSPDGKLAASAGENEMVRLWDTATGQEIAALKSGIDTHTDGLRQSVYGLAFSPDGKTLATAGIGGIYGLVRLWEVSTGRQIWAERGHVNSAFYTSVAFSPDGKRLVTGSVDKKVRIWDVVAGREVMVLSGHEDVVNGAIFSPDGTRVVTASNDDSARIWDAETGRELAILHGMPGDVFGLAFSPDGRSLATAHAEGLVLLWPYLHGQELLDRACALLVRPLSKAQREQYFLDPAPVQPRCGRAPSP